MWDIGKLLRLLGGRYGRPDAADPMNLIFAVTSLIERGDMERATFWYLIWQTRTRPWMAADSNVAQLRGALASGMTQRETDAGKKRVLNGMFSILVDPERLADWNKTNSPLRPSELPHDVD